MLKSSCRTYVILFRRRSSTSSSDAPVMNVNCCKALATRPSLTKYGASPRLTTVVLQREMVTLKMTEKSPCISLLSNLLIVDL